MDWPKAIAKNQAALAAIVAGLVAMVGLAEHLPNAVYRAVLRVLQPAESAVRRLIVMAARGVVLGPAPVRPWPKGRVIARKAGGSTRVPQFQLCDPRKRFDLGLRKKKKPSVWTKDRSPAWFAEVGGGPDPYDAGILCPLFRPRPAAVPVPIPVPVPVPAPLPDGSVSAKRLGRRLAAIAAALADIPRQAVRLRRWEARREAIQLKRPTFTSPLRQGPPPGHVKEPVDDVDILLNECHWLAGDALRENTS